MPQITDIQSQVRRQGRRSLFLDGEFWLGVPDELLGELGLSVGDRLSAQEVAAVELRLAQNQAMQAAGDLLGYRARSQQELERRLSERGLNPSAIAYAIAELERYGYVDDDEFSAQLIAGQRYKGRSRYSARQALMRAGVEEERLSAALEHHYPAPEEEQVALEWARGRFRPEDPERLRRQLSARGFSWETVSQVLAQLQQELASDA